MLMVIDKTLCQRGSIGCKFTKKFRYIQFLKQLLILLLNILFEANLNLSERKTLGLSGMF